MSKSIEEQREKIRTERNPKRFYKVNHLSIDINKVKAKNKKKKFAEVYRIVEELLGNDIDKSTKRKRKRKKSKKKEVKLSARQRKYREYLMSPEWIQLRIDLLQYRGYNCERCDNKKNLQIHHKHYRNVFKEEPEDLEIICNSCHKKEHNIKNKG